MSRHLSNRQICEFRTKLERCFDELSHLGGMICRQDFACCQSCGHAEIAGQCKNGEDYVFYHQQTSDSLENGANECYLSHSISEANVPKVMEVLHRFGSDWDGSANLAIVIPYRDYTLTQLEARKQERKEEAERVAKVLQEYKIRKNDD